MRTLAVVDFSYFLYLFRRSQKYSSLYRLENGIKLPIGHIVGMCRVIGELSRNYGAVILALDSPVQERFDALPTYKGHRHTPTGDPFEDYKIARDTSVILALLCHSFSNVFYVKHPDMESDDILASYIRWTGQTDIKVSLYFNDNDILAVDGDYSWFRSPYEGEVNREEYISDKYGLSMRTLPIVYKIVRGDTSDGIPAAIPRFPSKILHEACYALRLDYDFEPILQWFLDSGYKPGLITELKNTESDTYKQFYTNWQVIHPRVILMSELELKRVNKSRDEVLELVSTYQLAGKVEY